MITVIWKNLIHTKLLQMTKESINGQRPSTLCIFVCIYSLSQLNIKVRVFEDFGVVLLQSKI